MKTITTTGILSLLLFICLSASPVKEIKSSTLLVKKTTFAPSFDFFRTHRQGRGITSTWGLTSNTGVTGFVVMRTYEDPNDYYAEWNIVYSSPCGNLRSFKCTDDAVSAGTVSYQVLAMLQGGGMIASPVSTEKIVSR